MQLSFSINVLYSQLCIFLTKLLDPFNEWTQKNVDQGFSWRPGSVSFRSIEDGGTHYLTLSVVDTMPALNPSTIRAIEVPFKIEENASIEVGSIADGREIKLPSGVFLLRCEFKGERKVDIIFCHCSEPHFAVIKADAELVIEEPLLTTALPAQQSNSGDIP